MSECEFLITYSFEIKFLRLIQNTLVPSDFSIVASLERGETATDADIDLALAKCRYWFENVVSKTIAFACDNATAFDMLIDDEGTQRITNILMMVPDDPKDELLGALFQAKMNAFARGAFVVEAIDIKSDNMGGLSFALMGDHSIYLPRTMDEWLGAPSFFDTPWWHRDDASTLDVFCMDESKRDKKPSWAFSLDFLDKSKGKKVLDGGEGATVIRTSFQPKVIKGGKDDEPEDK